MVRAGEDDAVREGRVLLDKTVRQDGPEGVANVHNVGRLAQGARVLARPQADGEGGEDGKVVLYLAFVISRDSGRRVNINEGFSSFRGGSGLP